jgi:hypothetical protein
MNKNASTSVRQNNIVRAYNMNLDEARRKNNMSSLQQKSFVLTHRRGYS